MNAAPYSAENIRRRHAFAVPYAINAGVLSLLFALAIIRSVETILLLRGFSLAVILSWVGFAVGLGVGLLAYRRLVHLDTRLSEIERISESQSTRNWLSRLATAIILGFCVPGITLAVFWLLDPVVDNHAVHDAVVVLVITLYGSGIAYVLAGGLCMLGTGGLILMTGGVMFTGLALAVINAGDPAWFDNSLSFLGTVNGAAVVFQMTFVLAGVIMLAVMRDLMGNFRVLRDFEGISTRRYRSIQAILIALPLLVMGVGLFPIRISPLIDFLHNFSGHASALVNFGLMATIDRFAPIYPQRFVWQSRIGAVATVGVWIGYANLNLYNFVILELLLIVVIGMWTWRFYRETEAYMRDYVAQRQAAAIAMDSTSTVT